MKPLLAEPSAEVQRAYAASTIKAGAAYCLVSLILEYDATILHDSGSGGKLHSQSRVPQSPLRMEVGPIDAIKHVQHTPEATRPLPRNASGRYHHRASLSSSARTSLLKADAEIKIVRKAISMSRPALVACLNTKVQLPPLRFWSVSGIPERHLT